MAYTKNTWNDGDLITAEKLNKMEEGIEDAQNPAAYTLPAANKTTLGGVKQMALIADLSTETTADLKNKINAILAEMKKQGIMANS